MSENLNQWFIVPADSTLLLEVTGEASSDVDFVAHARCVPNQGDEEMWSDADLRPGPHEKTIDEDTSYAVRVTVKFFGNSEQTAVVRASVADPSGELLPDWWGDEQYVREVSGQGGHLERMTLIVNQD